MRIISLFFVISLFTNLPVGAFANTTPAPKESVTIPHNAELLQRTRAQNVDLAAVLGKEPEMKLDGPGNATPASYHSFLTAAFENFETLMFAPLKVTEKTPTAEVRTVCQAINKHIDQLVADAEIRQSMPLPTSLEEAKKLDELIQLRFQDFQTRFNKVGSKMKASGKIMGAKCGDLAKNPSIMQEAMKVAFAGYGPVGWCRAMMKKPQAEWTMEDEGKFENFCQGVEPN